MNFYIFRLKKTFFFPIRNFSVCLFSCWWFIFYRTETVIIFFREVSFNSKAILHIGGHYFFYVGLATDQYFRDEKPCEGCKGFL